MRSFRLLPRAMAGPAVEVTMHFRPPRRLRPPRPWRAPLLYCGLAIGLGFWGPELGARLFGDVSARMSAGSAIALLASIGTGMMALTGIVFSLIFVALQFGTTAYSPRLADEIGSNWVLPHGLGIFSGTFLYSILAIRAVDLESSAGIALPAAVVAFAWLVASVVVLVLLVPQIQTLSIVHVLDRLGRSGREAARSLYAPFQGGADRALPSASGNEAAAQAIRYAGPPGYFLGLHLSDLLRLARRHGALLRVVPSVGDPVFPDDILLEVVGATAPIPEPALRRAITVDKRRTTALNPMYALRLLADIAIRALSPAVNDPTTAVMALDQAQSVLSCLSREMVGPGALADDAGALRLVVPLPSWEEAVSLALTEIALYGGQSPQVQRRLGSLLADLCEQLPEERRPALMRMAERRQTVVKELFPRGERRTEASAPDRQGLGHTAEQRR